MKLQLCYGLILWLGSHVVIAQNDLLSSYSSHPSAMSIKLLRTIDGEWRLQAQQADLSLLLDKIAEQANLVLHYSVLPASTVTATCVGATIMELLQCVFNGSANIVSRKAFSQFTRDEIWVMSSSLAVATVVSASCQNAMATPSVDEGWERVEEWLKQANAKDTEQRAQAIAELGNVDTIYAAKVRGVLQNALTDSQSKVRARAIAAFAAREGEAATGAQLRKALQDNSIDVRMSALDMIEKDENLLNMAAQDKEQSVREMARLKLELLTQPQ